MSFLENVMERVNLQEKRNLYASVAAGTLVGDHYRMALMKN